MIISDDGEYQHHLNSLDCIRIQMTFEKYFEDKNTKRLLFLPLDSIRISLRTMEAKCPQKPNQFLHLIKAVN